MLLTMCMLAEPSVMAMAKSESEVQETEIQPGERTATIMVVSITGNELTYYEVEDETKTKVESEETEQSETDVDTEREESEISTDTDKKPEAVEKDAQTDDAEPEGTEGKPVQKDSSMTPPGGQQQRVAIARALVGEPAILLADEPTDALDQTSGKEVLKLFHRLHEMRNTIVMITHDLGVAQHAQRIVRIVDGELLEE